MTHYKEQLFDIAQMKKEEADEAILKIWPLGGRAGYLALIEHDIDHLESLRKLTEELSEQLNFLLQCRQIHLAAQTSEDHDESDFDDEDDLFFDRDPYIEDEAVNYE